MRRARKWAVLPALVLAGTQLMATDASAAKEGTRGGGEIAYIGAEYTLRDLVDPTTCDWYSGEDLRYGNPALNEILGSVESMDWYFGATLRAEIDSLAFCFTSELVRVRTEDHDSPIKRIPLDTKQAAIRFLDSNEVYVNRALFEGLTVDAQGYTVIHETMHSFISLHEPMRNQKLRSAVNDISKVHKGIMKSPRRFRLSMTQNGVNFPWTGRDLSRYKSLILFSLAAQPQKRAILLAEPEMDRILRAPDESLRTLIAPYHQAIVFASAQSKIRSFFEERDYEVLDRLLNKEAIQSFDPALMALSIPEVLDDAILLDFVLNSEAVKRGFSLYSKLSRKALRIIGARIGGTSELALLAAAPPAGEVPVLSLRAHAAGTYGAATEEVQGLVQFMAAQSKFGESGMRIIRGAVTKNDGFYSAFGMREVLAQLESVAAPVKREKAMVREHLPVLIDGFRAMIRAQLALEVGSGIASQIDQEIDWNRLKSN